MQVVFALLVRGGVLRAIPLVFGVVAGLHCAVARAAGADVPASGTELRLDTVTITASPLSGGDDVSAATPVSVLRGDALRDAQRGNLGATLSGQPGVQSSAYGAGAGRPIIRGMDSSRVRIAEGGLGVGDVSAASPDHRVAADSFNAAQVEVLRGPAALLYGSGAIGGLVNVVPTRIPLERIDAPQLDAAVSAASAERETTTSFGMSAPAGRDFVWRAEGFRDVSGDYSIAKPLRAADGSIVAQDRLPNSAVTTQSGALGGSWFGDGLVRSLGVAVQRYESDYGIPNYADPVTIRLGRTRVESRAELVAPGNGWLGLFSGARVKAGHTEYGHAEISPDGSAGARFISQSNELRVELPQRQIGGLDGAVGASFEGGSVRGAGEGVLPRTNSSSAALFALERLRIGAMRYEAGARAEHTAYRVGEPGTDDIQPPDRSFNLVTGSGAAFWSPLAGQEIGLTATLSQRAPSVQELYFVGAHPATFAYEIGNADLGRERSRNLELSYAGRDGQWRWKTSAYENRFKGYIHGAFDGTNTAVEGDDGETESLANLRYRQDDARFRGAEAEAEWQGEAWRLRWWGDLVRAVLTSGPHAGENLPRIAPARLGTQVGWRKGRLDLTADIVGVLRQNRVSQSDIRDGEPESQTPGHVLVGLRAQWQPRTLDPDMTFWLAVRNLFDADARVATSFLKDRAPLAGRSVVVGARFGF
ncbi:TonB-dependent receptor [Derxia gummosa]|uniref:TonB-dependent receptor n=1 Tax=Derxia gummosa DSM 723 TaxID=1121388 RepID=A0A8B6X701_9BURK|nr:TonB-dependent receptor [Derxia gummosa]